MMLKYVHVDIVMLVGILSVLSHTRKTQYVCACFAFMEELVWGELYLWKWGSLQNNLVYLLLGIESWLLPLTLLRPRES